MDQQPHDQIGGRYRLIEPLGKGAMGVVFKAHDPVLDRVVAIKRMTAEIARDANLRQRFYVEARAAARLNHPNIVTIYELGELQDDAFIVMELLEGMPLSQIIRQQSRLSVSDVLDLAAQVADGLDYAHRHGIVHRDIKPSNLHVAANGSVKILDFGIARFGSVHMTASGVLIGTPDYMAPEQARGGEIDGRADLFSLGAVIYELVSGAKPFAGGTLAAVLTRLMREPHVPLADRAPDTPPALSALVDRLLAKDRASRPATAAEVRTSLMAIGERLRDTGSGPATLTGDPALSQTIVGREDTAGEITEIRRTVDAGTPGAPASADRGIPSPLTPVSIPDLVPPISAPSPAVTPSASAAAPAGAAVEPPGLPPAPDVEPPAVAPPLPAPRSGDGFPSGETPPAVSAHSVASSPPNATHASPNRVTGRAPRSGRGLVAAAAVVVAVAGTAVLAWWWWAGRVPVEPPRAASPAGAPGGEAAAAADPALPGQAAVAATAPPIDIGGAVSGQDTTDSGRGGGRSATANPGDTSPAADRAAARGEKTTPGLRGADPEAGAGGTVPKAEARLPRSESGRAAEGGVRPPAAPLAAGTVDVLTGGRGDVDVLSRSAASVAAEARIRWVLEQYALAFERNDPDLARTHRNGLSEQERQWLEPGGRITLRLDDLRVVADETAGTVQCRRLVEGHLATGAVVRDERAITVTLVRRPAGWVITQIR